MTILLTFMVIVLALLTIATYLMLGKQHDMFNEMRFDFADLHNSVYRTKIKLYNKSEYIVQRLKANHTELTELFGPVQNKPQVFLKGNDSMNYNLLVYTVARPQLTAGDIKEVIYFFYIGDNCVGQKTTTADVEAIDFKVEKGTKGVKVGVAFRDTSENMSEVVYSEVFDAIDTIAPPEPSDISITVREATDADADVIENKLNDDVQPEPTPDENEGDDQPNEGDDENNDDEQGELVVA